MDKHPPIETILQKYWGYDSFRELQREIIESTLNGDDTLALMPTGGGKSITYQVSSLAREGICIVVTPLISLMKDQVDALRSRRIMAQSIHSGLTFREIDTILDNCVYGDYKFLYVSPERLETDIFKTRFARMNVSMIAVDEAHCISQWGYDFRPSYLEIAKLREIQPNVPILAVTATATPLVAEDIMNVLQFNGKKMFSMSFERRNLSYIVRHVENKYEHLLRIIVSLGGTGIIYCRTRGRTEEIAEKLKQSGISADFYHAGLSSKIRALKQDDWIKERTSVIVATNAFGMGIDKSNVRYVVHYEMPSTIEAYYQEAGRAGRDGNDSFAILLYDNNDLGSTEKRFESEFPPIDTIREVYHALYNYLGIAIGDGMGSGREFNIYDFCSRFKLFSVTALSSIKILQLNNYLTLTDELDNPTRIKITSSREELYRIELQHLGLESFIRILLRVYTGLFSELTAIDEEYLAKVSGYTVPHIAEMLLKMSRLRIITYIPRKRTPILLLKEERLPKENLYISPHTYALRKKIAADRLNSTLKYVTEQEECRSIMLRHYFGEEAPEACGKCDVCRRKKTNSKSEVELETKIIDLIERGINNTHEIPRHISGDASTISGTLRKMIAAEMLTQHPDGTLSRSILPTKED